MHERDPANGGILECGDISSLHCNPLYVTSPPPSPRGRFCSLPGGLMEIERRLSDVLSEFARTLVTDFPIQAILDHLVVRIVDVLPISAAGVTLISPEEQPHYIAA